MRPAIGLLVEPDDVDDPHVFDLGRDQVGGGADDVGKRERLLAGQHAHVDTPVGVDLHVAEILDGQPEPVGDGRIGRRPSWPSRSAAAALTGG